MSKKKQTNNTIGLDEELSKSAAFLERHMKTILIALAAVVILVVLGMFWKHHSAQKDQEAATKLGAVMNVYSSAMSQVAQGVGDTGTEVWDAALNGDGVTNPGFLKVIKDYGSTKSGNLAKLYAGICYAHKGDTDQAIKMLEDYKQGDDEMVSPLSLAALGNLYIAKGDQQKGIDYLLKAAKKGANDAVAPVCLLQAGEAYEAMGKADEALKLYEQIKSDYTTCALTSSGEINKYIERVKK